MSRKTLQLLLRDTVIPFAQSLAVAFIFSPWLLVIYSFASNYAAGLDPNDQQVIKGFIEWFGAAYSFFLALAIVNVWSQFETVEREFDRELDAIATLRQTVHYTRVSSATRRNEALVRDFKRDVLQEIRDYLMHVIAHHRLEHIVPEQHRNGDRLLENIGEHISTLTVSKAVPEPFIYELFTSLNEAVDVRGDRILHCQPYTPIIVQLVSLVSSLLWLFSFLGLVIYDKLVATLLIGGVSFVIIMVMVIFFDLGEPFGGIWRIHLDEWQEFIETMDHDQDPQVILIYLRQNSLLGRVRSYAGREACKLYDLVHSKVQPPAVPWKDFKDSLQRPRANGNPRIQCRTLYCNELDYHGISLTGCAWPAVILKQGGQRTVILDRQAIENCADLAALQDQLHRSLQAALPWYQP